jgi:acyl carrier protein
MTDVKERLRTFILESFLQGESPANLRDDTRLRTTGILDSLAILSLVSFVEKEFGVELTAYETGADNFDRIEDIAALVARKQSGLSA